MGRGEPGQRARRHGRLTAVRGAVVAAVVWASMAGVVGAVTTAKGPYAGSGHYKVTTTQVTAPDGDQFDVFRPASYSALGFKSPIVTWGNGTGGNPDNYTTLLDHLASWGFTVIASTLQNTGSGNEILEGARYLVAADGQSKSPYFGHLDVAEVAAMGHSQGAGGALRATLHSGKLIKTLVTFSLPWNGQGPKGTKWDAPGGLGYSGANPDCPTGIVCWSNPSDLHVPTFFISTRGPFDQLIANPTVERCYLDEVDAPAAQGVITTSDGKAADHPAPENLANGGEPDTLLTYTTAWLLYELRHNQAAGAEFFGPHPSLLKNPDWLGSAVKKQRARLHSDCQGAGYPGSYAVTQQAGG